MPMLMKKILKLSAFAWLLSISLSSCFTSNQYTSTATSGDTHQNKRRHNTTDEGLFRKAKSDEADDEGYVAENKPVFVSFTKTPYTDRPVVDDVQAAAKEPAKDDDRALPKSLRKKYAAMLGVSYKEIHNKALFRFIDHWYGTNYRLGGTDKSGIDCSAFAQKLFNDVYGVDLQRTAMQQFTSCKRIKNRKYAHEGDLVFFRVHSKRITHVGVYLTNDYFVHASTSQGVVISNLSDDYWHKYYVGMGRIPN
jgi:cell wall-associated NlpC family hydrolase